MEIIKSLEESKYHSQESSDTPLFSYSTAKTLLQKSPYHAWLNHPKLGNQRELKSSKAMDIGNIIHKLLLGVGADIVEIDADNYKTKIAREKRDEAYMNGQVPILPNEMREIEKMLGIYKPQIEQQCPEFFGEHDSELSVYWEMNNGVKCQSRFDWSNRKSGQQIDLKTTNDVNPEKLMRNIVQFGYEIQESMYTMAAEQIWPELAGRIDFSFLFLETEPPYQVSLVHLDSSFKWLGEQKAFRAADTWKECILTDNWPSYGKQIISAPQWEVKKEQEKAD